MSVLTALARVRAMRTGRAQPLATVRHYHLSPRPFVLIPLRLAGEAAAPLAVMFGTDRDEPTVLIVPQPRDRVLRLRFLEALAGHLLPHLASYLDAAEDITDRSGEVVGRRCLDAAQLWVPNTGGVDFLGLLGRSVRYHRVDGPNPVPAEIPLLGRWLTWFAERAERPGSAALLPMTSVLAMHWASGQSALEDANLAALLGWIDPPAGLSGAQAAAFAEDPLASPPAGPATDPGFDNEELAPLVNAYDTAIDDVDGTAKTVAAQRLEVALRAQLEPTWQLMWRGLDLLARLPEAANVPTRWQRDRGSFTYFADNIDDNIAQARRDAAVSAVRRLLDREAAAEAFQAQRAYDDPRVMAEYRVAGAALRGEVTACEPDRVDTSGKRAVLRPLIRVETSDPFTAAPGETLFSAERPNQKAKVLDVDGGVLVLELSGGMGTGRTAKPGTVPQPGDQVGFTRFPLTNSAGKLVLPEPEETPWTHGGPPPEFVPDHTEESW
ncbi:hypothetical protein ACTD5D_30545 [Nocardia takedensis]|uniref:hypothetical protein n=1 Tax=Nocardia takedensis TaxID=259390 RepID=UPI0002D5CD81|nr:hypothetical protein [Nocardia takedensis]